MLSHMQSKVLNFQPHQRRVVVEAFDLQEKTDKLKAFLTTPQFQGLDEAEQNRLRVQLTGMEVYLETLDRRLAAFETQG